MEIYLDESGDMGFDFKSKHPSRYFVITALACRHKVAKGLLRRAVTRTLKNKVNRKARNIKNELKGSGTKLKDNNARLAWHCLRGHCFLNYILCA